MEIFDQLGLPLVVLIVVTFIGWFVIGGEYNRRRAGRLAQWVYRGLKPYLGKASVRWLTTHAFEVFVENPKPPFASLKVTGLLESRDMVAIWLYNRIAYRPDLLVLRANLHHKPIWGFEAFRARTILSGDARQQAEEEGWTRAEPRDGELESWHGGGKAEALCQRLLDALGESRRDLIRLAVHRQEPHLVVALSAARFQQEDPQGTFARFKRLAEITLEYATK